MSKHVIKRDIVTGREYKIERENLEVLYDNWKKKFTAHLKELKDLCKVNVIIIACQVENIPTEVTTTISKKLIDVIPEVSKRINEIIKKC